MKLIETVYDCNRRFRGQVLRGAVQRLRRPSVPQRGQLCDRTRRPGALQLRQRLRRSSLRGRAYRLRLFALRPWHLR